MKNLRLVLLGLAAVLALMLAGTFLLRAVKGPSALVVESEPAPVTETKQPDATTPPALTPARAAIDRAIAGAPDYTRFFDRLHLVFPSEYETILDGLAAANARTKTVNPDLVMTDAVTALRRARGGLASKASDEALGQIFTLQLKEMRELETRDPHLCVAFLYGASGAGFLNFAADHRGLIADVAIAGLDAMSNGQTNNANRGAPSDDDFQMLDKALVEKGLSRPQIEALLDGKTADPPIDDDTMCKGGETYLETLAALPQDVRARLYGLAIDLMAKS